MNHHSGYRGVVFDLDGTLVDSYDFLEKFSDISVIVRARAGQ